MILRICLPIPVVEFAMPLGCVSLTIEPSNSKHNKNLCPTLSMRLPFTLGLRKAQHTNKGSCSSPLQRSLQYWSILDHRASNGKIPFIHYSTEVDKANADLNELQGDVLGFDIEWPINTWRYQRNPTSLVQLCDSERIVLIHIAKMGGVCPRKLRDIMENQEIVKCGVAIRHDCRRLYKEFQINSKALIELSEATKIADPLSWQGGERLIALTDLAAAYLGKSLYKGTVRISDWSKALTFNQQLCNVHYTSKNATDPR